MSEDLKTLFPGRDVTLSTGEVLALKPFYFGQFPSAIRLMRPVTEAVQSSGIAGFSGTGFVLASDWAMRLPQLMDEAGEALIEFIAFSTNKQRSWFDVLGADDGIALTKAVFEVNADFFVQRIAPLVGLAIQPQAVTETVETGAASSPDSSQPATDLPTSS